MSLKKRDLEIIYKLQWKNRPFNGADKATTIVGIYDTPATTLKWEFFKKYLLKNSGTTGNDFNISYLTSEDVEIPIESETDFQIALYSFRNKARHGEIINLILDRHTGVKPKRQLTMNTFHTQTDAQCSNCCDALLFSEPPDWFKKYMKQVKTEMVKEVTEAVVNSVGHLKVQPTSQPACYHMRKSKSESKRSRKAAAWLIGEAGNDKEILKSLKLEHKLENKLEKLERKTLKIKEKKAAHARSSDSDIGRGETNAQPFTMSIKEDELSMDASTITQFENIIPHLMGGDTYMQQWEVVNTGKEAWTDDTEIRYAWGSKLLTPVKKSVACPKLMPGEKGPVSVLLNVPNVPGSYECHWYFYHRGRRFGHSLDSQLIVDVSQVKISLPNVLELALPSLIIQQATCKISKYMKDELENSSPINSSANVVTIKQEEMKPLNSVIDTDVQNVSDNLEKFSINDLAVDANCSSDSDNQSIISLADSNTSENSGRSSEFVIVSDFDGEVEPRRMTQEQNNIQKNNVVPNENEDNNNNIEGERDENLHFGVVVKDVPLDLSQNIAPDGERHARKETEETENAAASEYAYINLNGKKFAVPKHVLREDYLTTAEDAPDPTLPTTESAAIAPAEVPSMSEAKRLMLSSKTEPTYSHDFSKLVNSSWVASEVPPSNASHCSTATCFSGDNGPNARLFVFPQNCAGFEVVQPQLDSFTWNLSTSQRESSCEHNYPAFTQANAPELEKPLYEMSNSSYGFQLPSNVKYNPYGPLDDDRKGDFLYSTPMAGSPTSHCSYPNFYQTPNNLPDNSQNFVAQGNNGPVDARSASNFSIPTPPSFYSSTSNNVQENSQHFGQGNNGFQRMSMSSQNNEAAAVPQNVHMLPENLVTGAVNVASSAINTARSVLNMIVPQRQEEAGKFMNGHWVTTNPESKREINLKLLEEMGFKNRDYNATLLNRYEDDVEKVVFELLK